ncbi:hypothetical protein DL546_006610 [Coniochaeta pulveracea]|uniref:Ubiquitin 3 binding protein But2 C-terminal domain-containing protein n=1 Tax=Coniochaeta pulveracea TaxID=177199 RepID=A0A420YCU5_9PEZI|nr:hypothetical protein DL546_006610 [Coniochaeta pulveracea]
MYPLNLLVLSFAFALAAAAGLTAGHRELEPQQTSLCCFGLWAVQIPRLGAKSNTEGAHLDQAEVPSSRYCLDLRTSRFVSHEDAKWLLNSGKKSTPDSLYCSTEPHGQLGYSVTTQADGTQYLVGNGSADFVLGPNATSSECLLDDAQSVSQTEASGIPGLTYKLFLTASTQNCIPTMSEGEALSSHLADVRVTSTERLVEVRDLSELDSADAPDPSLTCSTSGSSPSLAPTLVWVGDAFDTNMVLDPSPNFAAAISPTQASAFQFHIPGDWRGVGKCALWFRLPYCTELPPGFPCYNFSGLEQEYVGHGGMLFTQIQDVPPSMNWRQQSLVQVTPGFSTLVGTFDCSAAADDGGGKLLYWLVQSQNHFLLQYMQPDQNRHVDNIGLWIVACDK